MDDSQSSSQEEQLFESFVRGANIHRSSAPNAFLQQSLPAQITQKPGVFKKNQQLQRQAGRQALAQHGPGRNQFKSLNLSKRSLVQKKKLKNQLNLSKLRTKMKSKLAAQMDLDSDEEP